MGFGWCCNPFAGDAANTIKEAYEQYKVFMMVNRSLILSIERIEEVSSSSILNNDRDDLFFLFALSYDDLLTD